MDGRVNLGNSINDVLVHRDGNQNDVPVDRKVDKTAEEARYKRQWNKLMQTKDRGKRGKRKGKRFGQKSI